MTRPLHPKVILHRDWAYLVFQCGDDHLIGVYLNPCRGFLTKHWTENCNIKWLLKQKPVLILASAAECCIDAGLAASETHVSVCDTDDTVKLLSADYTIYFQDFMNEICCSFQPIIKVEISLTGFSFNSVLLTEYCATFRYILNCVLVIILAMES